MDAQAQLTNISYSFSVYPSEEDHMEVRKGPWTVEEDSLLLDYVTHHGEGRWNTVARSAGLKRTGKSCRLRWLNYLRPNVRRGNITLQEQLLILQLHSRWGNRWSKIAEYLPGRTDNEIKNYWRTRVQKQAKQLKCDVNSKQFRDAMQHIWIPRLIERIRAASDKSSATQSNHTTAAASTHQAVKESGSEWIESSFVTEMSGISSDYSLETHVSPVSEITDSQHQPLIGYCSDQHQETEWGLFGESNGNAGSWDCFGQDADMEALVEPQSTDLFGGGGDSLEDFWNDENFWF